MKRLFGIGLGGGSRSVQDEAQVRYQSHGGDSSISDSGRKLDRIRLPESLEGKRVLDIGCNEGFFSAAAARRGANVVGLDNNLAALAFAREQYGELGIEFIHSTWDKLPSGPFDIVLWTSAMHYERDPARILATIADRLAPGGLLILECGVTSDTTRVFLPVPRHNDICFYPSEILLGEILDRRFVWRQVADPELTPGDPVPRAVYYCTRRLPTVVLICGSSAQGKSALARQLAPNKLLVLDRLLQSLSKPGGHATPLRIWLQGRFNKADLEPVYRELDKSELSGEFADFIDGSIADTDGLVVVEGVIGPKLLSDLKARLERRALVWIVRRSTEPGPSAT